MGEVYRARDTRLNRDVAVKVLPAAIAGDAQLRLRFEREAKAISSLSHPNICRLYDVGREEGVDFVVLELIDGENLADRLSRGPLPLDQVLRYGAEIADALDAAHRSGIVHRDLKPGNVMLTRTGAKLLDFGLAKYADPITIISGQSVAATEQKPLTEEGTVVGTFQYMAPEQIEGMEADPRTDIFALGAVLYELATGQRAFVGKNRTSLIAAIVSSQPPPVSRTQPLTPPALDHVIQRCLAKEPADRWQSAKDVAEELKWIASEGSAAGVAAPVAARRRQREKTWAVLACLFAAVAIALGVVLLRQESPTVREVRAEIVPPRGATLSLSQDASAGVTISPDGRWVTFESMNDLGERTLSLRPVGSIESRPLYAAAEERPTYPFWSPDSRSVGFFAGGKLKRIDISGGPATNICDASEGRGGAWNGDGTIIFTPHWRGPLFRVPAEGGKPEPLTQLDEKQSETTHRFPAFLPDGRHFVYLAATHLADTRSDLNAIYVGSLDSPERKLLLRARSNAMYAAGHLLFVRENYLLAQPFDVRTRQLTGEPRRIADSVHYEPGFFRAVFAAATDGTIVYAPSVAPAATQLTWTDRAGQPLESVGELAAFHRAVLSRDGRNAAAVVADPSDIWIYDLSRGLRRRLTIEPLNEFNPVWSPDGRTVAYSSDRDVQVDIYARPADGNGPEVPLLKGNDIKEPNAWSPDGRFLLFTRVPLAGFNADLWMLPMNGQGSPVPYLQSPFGESWGVFSPDGRWVAFINNESGRDEVYATSFPTPGRRYQISTAGGRWPVWTADEIIYEAPDATLHAVAVRATGEALEIGRPQPLFKIALQSEFDSTRDGKRFLVTTPREKTVMPNLTLVTGGLTPP